jgi:hypothetical protein
MGIVRRSRRILLLARKNHAKFAAMQAFAANERADGNWTPPS